jgi:hypothetical protein
MGTRRVSSEPSASPRRGRALTDVRARDRDRSGEAHFRRERKVLG